jgi:hypothetical protein
MKVRQALGAMSDRLAVQYEISSAERRWPLGPVGIAFLSALFAELGELGSEYLIKRPITAEHVGDLIAVLIFAGRGQIASPPEHRLEIRLSTEFHRCDPTC